MMEEIDSLRKILHDLGSEDLETKTNAEQEYIGLLQSQESILIFLEFFKKPCDTYTLLLLKQFNSYVKKFWKSWDRDVKVRIIINIENVVAFLIQNQRTDYIPSYFDIIETVFLLSHRFSKLPFYNLLIINTCPRFPFSETDIVNVVGSVCDELQKTTNSTQANYVFWLDLVVNSIKDTDLEDQTKLEIMEFTLSKLSEIAESEEVDPKIHQNIAKLLENTDECILCQGHAECLHNLILSFIHEFAPELLLQASQGLCHYIINTEDKDMLKFLFQLSFETSMHYIDTNPCELYGITKYLSNIPLIFKNRGKSYIDIFDLFSDVNDDITSRIATLIILVISSDIMPLAEEQEHDISERFIDVFDEIDSKIDDSDLSDLIQFISSLLESTIFSATYRLDIVYQELLVPSFNRIVNFPGQYDCLVKFVSTSFFYNPQLVEPAFLDQLIESNLFSRSLYDFTVMLHGLLKSLPSDDRIFEVATEALEKAGEAKDLQSLFILIFVIIELYPDVSAEIYANYHDLLMELGSPQEFEENGEVYEQPINNSDSHYIITSIEQLTKLVLVPIPDGIKDLFELQIPNIYNVINEFPSDKFACVLKSLFDYFGIEFDLDVAEIEFLKESNSDSYYEYLIAFGKNEELADLDMEDKISIPHFISTCADKELALEVSAFLLNNIEFDSKNSATFSVLKELASLEMGEPYLDECFLGFLEAGFDIGKDGDEIFVFLDLAFRNGNISINPILEYARYVSKIIEDQLLMPCVSDGISLVGFNSPENLGEFAEIINTLLQNKDSLNAPTTFLLYLALSVDPLFDTTLVIEALSHDPNEVYLDFNTSIGRIYDLTESDNKEVMNCAIQFLVKLLARSTLVEGNNSINARIESFAAVAQRLRGLCDNKEIKSIVEEAAANISGGRRALYYITYGFKN